MSAPAISLKGVPDEVASVVVKSFNDIDTSRRVGWAKMYAAIAAGEKAERELGIAREDLALLSRFAGFTFGALQGFGLYDIYQTYLKGDTSKLTSYFEDGAMNQGRNVASQWVDDWKARLVDKTAYLEARAKAHEANEKQFKAAKRQVCEELCAEFGFADEAAMRAHLARRTA